MIIPKLFSAVAGRQGSHKPWGHPAPERQVHGGRRQLQRGPSSPAQRRYDPDKLTQTAQCHDLTIVSACQQLAGRKFNGGEY